MKNVIRVLAVVLAVSQSACVAGYSSRGGGFIWPGGIGLLVLIIVVVLLLRRRR